MCKAKENSMVYTADDIKDILSISRTAVYAFLDEVYKDKEPFKVIKIGKSIRVPKESFDQWFFGSNAS